LIGAGVAAALYVTRQAPDTVPFDVHSAITAPQVDAVPQDRPEVAPAEVAEEPPPATPDDPPSQPEEAPPKREAAPACPDAIAALSLCDRRQAK